MRPDILNPLFAEITALKGVGPQLARPLERLGLARALDVGEDAVDPVGLDHELLEALHRDGREVLARVAVEELRGVRGPLEQRLARFLARGGLERSRGARIVEGAGTGPIPSGDLGTAESSEPSTPKRLSSKPPESIARTPADETPTPAAATTSSPPASIARTPAPTTSSQPTSIAPTPAAAEASASASQ